jgi:pyruvate formate lyase activating enzyme
MMMQNSLPDKEIKRYLRKIKQKNSSIQCMLCPRQCIIAEGKAGACNVRINNSGRLFLSVYGKPVSIHIDPIEKKPLYHFHPGERILSIGTVGCNLFCKGCQNYDISRAEIKSAMIRDKSDKIYTAELVVDAAIKNNISMIAYTYNEPTIFFEYMIDIAKAAKKRGIKNVIVSNGYINPEPLDELLKYIDAANIDLKGFTEEFYGTYCNARLKCVLSTLKHIVSYNKTHKHNVWLEITNLLIPKLNDNPKDILLMCRWIRKNLGDIPLHFSKFFPYYDALEFDATPAKTLQEARDIALSEKLSNVYLGNMPSDNNTYCNNCRTILIRREGYDVTIEGINNKKCISCGKRIEGVWT